jgi:molybdopterin converting factor small subunit
MDVDVTLYPPLRYNRFSRASVSLEQPATIDTLLDHLAIKQHEVGSVYVNGVYGIFSQPLAPGDRVTLLPLIGGG